MRFNSQYKTIHLKKSLTVKDKLAYIICPPMVDLPASGKHKKKIS